MQSAECQIILLWGLRNFSGMPHHLHRISLSSPTPAPIPCCIVYLVFYFLDYTFHISVWLFYFIFLYFSPLLESQHFQGPCPSPHQSHFPVVLCIWYSIILIRVIPSEKTEKKTDPFKMWFFCMEIDYWTNQWWFVPFLAFGGPLGGPGGPGGFLGGQENPKLSISIWDQIKLWDAGFWAKTTCHTMFLIFQAQSGPLGPKKGKFGPK